MKRLNVKLVAWLLVSSIILVVGVYVLHGWQLSSTTALLRREAEEAEEAKDLPRAIEKYQQYLQFSGGGDPETQIKFALLTAEIADGPDATRRDRQKAYFALDEAVRRDPSQDAVRRKLLDVTLKFQSYGEAKQHAEILLRTSPNDAKLLTELARCEAAVDQERKAVETLRQAITKDPQEVDAYMWLAVLLRHKLNEAEKADSVAESMINANRENASAYLHHAGYLQGKRKGASKEDDAKLSQARKADAKKALELAPDNADAILLATDVYKESKEFDPAKELLRKGIEKHPKDERLHRELAGIALFQGKREQAEAQVKEGIKESPDDPYLRMLKVDLEMDKGNLDAARKEIDELESREVVSPYIVAYLRARVLFAEQKWSEAADKLKDVRPLLPQQQVTIDLLLGRCHEILGQPDRQLEDYERALAASPGLPAAQIGKAAALVATGKLDDGRKLLEGLLQGMGAEAFVKNPLMRNNLFNLLLERNSRLPEKDRDWTKVNELINAIAKVQPDAPETALWPAEVFARMNNLPEAKKALEAVRDKDPKSIDAWLGLVRLAERQQDKAAALAVVDQAQQALGDLVALRIARVGIVVQGDEEPARKALSAAAQDTDKFKAEEQDRLWHALGACYYRLKDTEQARRWWMKSLERNPYNLRLRLALFEIANQAKDNAAMQAQIDDLKKMVRGESPEVYYFQARLLVHQAREKGKDSTKSLDEAQRLLKRAAELRPQWTVVLRAQAEVDDMQGRRDDAIAHLERAVELGDTETLVLTQLVELLISRGRGPDADRYATMMTARNPDAENNMLVSLAEIERLKGNLPKAIELSEKAVDKNKDDPRKLLYLGQLYNETGRADDAEKMLRRAVDKGADMPLTWLALIKLLVDSGKSKEAREVMDQIGTKMPEQEALLVLAQGYELLKDIVQAETQLRTARDAKPDDLGLSRVLSMFYFRTGQVDKGRAELERIVAASPKTDSDRHHQGWANRETARLKVATDRAHDTTRIALQPLRDKKDKTVEDKITMAAILADRPDAASRQEAIEILEEAGSNLTAEGRYTLAVLYERVGNWNKCREQMLGLLTDAKQEKKPKYLAHFVELLLKHGEVELARTWVEKLEQLYPKDPLTIASRARWLVRNGQKDEGIALLRSLLPQPLPPQFVGRLAQVARVMEELELYEAAENMYREYVVLVPKDILVLAEYFGRRGRLKEALDVCEQALDTAPPEAVAQVSLTALRSQQKLAAAAEWQRIEGWFDAGLAKKPDSLLLKLQKAEFYDLQGKQHEVESMYRDLLKDPNLQRDQKALVMNNLAFLLALQGKTGESRQFIEQAIEVLGPTSDLLDTLAMVLLSEGEARKAINELNKALRDKPSGTKLFHLAQAYQKANDPSGAAEAMRRATEDFNLKFSDLGPLEQPMFTKLIAQLGLTK